MRVHLSHPGVFVTEDRIVAAAADLIRQLKEEAPRAARRRVRFCAHPGAKDRLHEMLIAMTRDTYFRPHRHHGKSESFHVIEGAADVVIFDDAGAIRQVVALGDYASGKSFFYRVNEPLFHVPLVHSDLFVIHETTNGPLREEDCEFAPWAPPESDAAAARAFLLRLRERAAAFRPGAAAEAAP